MKSAWLKTFAFFALAGLSFACTSASETASVNEAVVIANTVYDCTYFGLYNSLAACQAATNATCTSESDTFPNNTVGTCFVPPAGDSACAVAQPTWDWIYGSGQWCDTGTNDGTYEIYQETRSLIGCSSSVCSCNNPVKLQVYCAGPSNSKTPDLNAPSGTIGCGNYPFNPAATPGPTSADPNATATPSPTPVPVCVGGSISPTPTPVIIPLTYNFIGIEADDTVFPSTDGFDHAGNAFPSSQFGTSITFEGIPFVLGPTGANDMINSTVGLSLTPPISGNFSKLVMLGSALGNQPTQNIIVNYTDGSTATYNQAFSDWTTGPENNSGETTVAYSIYQNTYGGTENDLTRAYIYGFVYALDNTKTVSSIVTPANVNVQFFGVGLLY